MIASEVGLKLGEGVADVGGLYIIGTERHESRRIDNQLRGRSGRQGDPGETRFFLSFEDDLMRVFGGERMQGIMDRLHVPDDAPLESRMVTRQIEGAQSRVEGHNFDSRRHVVEYDDVMNKQREIIYGERRKILEGTDTRNNLLGMVGHVVSSEVPTFVEGRNRDSWDLEGLWDRMREFAASLPPLNDVNLDSLGTSAEQVIETITEELTALYEEKEQQYGVERLRAAEQWVMLTVIDQRWRAYLTQMDHLREGIGLQAYGQKDPLIEYKQAAFESFQDLTEDIQREIVRAMLNVQIVDNPPADGSGNGAQPAAPSGPTDGAAQATAPPSPRADKPGSATDGGQVPPARPAAAAASGALARASVPSRTSAPLASQQTVRNVVESAGGAARQVGGGGGGGGGGGTPVATGASGKVGRNQPCPCGSGKKYKFCHGR